MTKLSPVNITEFDTIVVGSGLAGLTAAYHASKKGSVAIVTKSQLDTSNSYYAQGGIAAVISAEDSCSSHVNDTLIAGRELCEPDAVQILVSEGRQCVHELIDEGMQFDKENGEFVLGLEGGHSHRRILHAGGDSTGKGLTLFMLGKVKQQNNITVFEHTVVVDLLVVDNECLGVHTLNLTNGNNILVRSKATILATGGLSRVYGRSTNPHTATGDGIALAYHGGAKLADIEFVQFHPSALAIPGKEAFLISEAVRGEGAWLLGPQGDRFMLQVHPLAELAPRDVVAHTIFNQMQIHQTKFVYLCLRHLDPENIKKRFSTIYHTLLEYEIDLTRDLLPVSPAAHYMVGGVQTDLHGETSIHRLFACGEVASTGVMGANRLASNSLLECLVFGKRAAEQASRCVSSTIDLPSSELVYIEQSNEDIFLDIKNKIADLMGSSAGIIRSGNKLAQAIKELESMREHLDATSCEYNILKTRYLVDICSLICESALIREESRGGHIRDDYPNESPTFRAHLIRQKDTNPIFQEIQQWMKPDVIL